MLGLGSYCGLIPQGRAEHVNSVGNTHYVAIFTKRERKNERSGFGEAK